MEVSIKTYQETDEQRTIRVLREIVDKQQKLIQNQDNAIKLRDKLIEMREKQREGFVELVVELIKEIDDWRMKAGQKKLSTDFFEACAKDPELEATVIKMKKS